jgi:hypothetical protein
MSRYVGRHRRVEPDPEPPESGPVSLAVLPGGSNVWMAPEPAETLTFPAGEPTELLPASTWADPEGDEPRPPRRRGPGGKFIKDGPDEQEDAEDKDPEPGDPIRQVPGEKDPDPRV